MSKIAINGSIVEIRNEQFTSGDALALQKAQSMADSVGYPHSQVIYADNDLAKRIVESFEFVTLVELDPLDYGSVSDTDKILIH